MTVREVLGRLNADTSRTAIAASSATAAVDAPGLTPPPGRRG